MFRAKIFYRCGLRLPAKSRSRLQLYSNFPKNPRNAASVFADDVVNVTAEKGVVLVNQATFAKIFGPTDDLPPQFGADVDSAQATR